MRCDAEANSVEVCMIEIRKIEDLKVYNGFFQGALPTIKNTLIQIKGENNILYCEDGVSIKDSKIYFKGDNSLVYLSSSASDYKLNVNIHHDCVLSFGGRCYINKAITIILSEQRHVIIGKRSIFSTGIKIRNADSHLIYDYDSYERINQTKSVFLGDHIWIGHDAVILKGTQISSGAIIGAASVVAGKKIAHNTSNAGNPVREIKKNIFWDGSCVDSWREDKTMKSQTYKAYSVIKKWSQDEFKYEYDPKTVLDFDSIDSEINSIHDVDERLDYIKRLNHNENKNRFVMI